MKSIVKDANNRCSYVHTFEAVKSKAKKTAGLKRILLARGNLKQIEGEIYNFEDCFVSALVLCTQSPCSKKKNV